MNRFSGKKHVYQVIHIWQFFLVFFLIIFAVFFYGIRTIDHTTHEKQLESLRNTIHQDIVHCYAVEGTYPPNLDYLKEHYGLTYDESSFFVDFTSIGSNIMPDVTIIEEGK